MNTFSAIAVLFGITALLSYVNDRYLGLQQNIGLLLLAVVATLFLVGLEQVTPIAIVDRLRVMTGSFTLNDTLLKGVLCFMLFRGSVAVRWSSLREQRWLVLSLAFVGTALGCVLTGLLAVAGLALFGVEIGLVHALLFGALIPATDPIAALAILSKLGLPKNIETVIDGESLLNDGVAVVLFTIFAGMAIGGMASETVSAVAREGSAIFFREVLGGAVLGAAGWVVIHHLMTRADTYITNLLASLGAVACLYALASHLHVSGPIATVVAGLLSGNVTAARMRDATRAELRVFWAGLDEILNALLFVYVGLHVVLINPIAGITPGVPGLVAILAVLLARAITVAAIVGSLQATGRIHARWMGLTRLLTWGGLRGGLSLALAASLPPSDWQLLILNMTFAVVVFSIVVQGLTIGRLFSQAELHELLR